MEEPRQFSITCRRWRIPPAAGSCCSSSGGMQLPQSTVSRHLKALADSGWVASRGEGTSNVYTMTRDLDTAARRLWLLVREQVGSTPAAVQDQRRLQTALADRR